MGKLLAVYNAQICKFKLTDGTVFMAGSDVFPNVEAFPAEVCQSVSRITC